MLLPVVDAKLWRIAGGADPIFAEVDMLPADEDEQVCLILIDVV